ncbi:MAG: hypothetical protein A2X32_04375 [Elusimicrobia bacterium GWC2_64_44]|nr:MAG: hypothetical protein A2X32_04375 [Elusimicrobia bacterium GWC2_64_44]
MTIITAKNLLPALFVLTLSAGVCGAGQMESLRGAGARFGYINFGQDGAVRIPGPPKQRPAGLLPPEVAAKLPELGIKLEEEDLWRLQELYNLWRQAGDALWPGLQGLETTPLQFSFPHKYNILLGHPNPPADCVPFSDRLPATSFCYRKDAAFAFGGLAGPVNGIPTVSFNTLALQDEYVNQVYPGNNYKADYLQTLATVSHELLHAFQYREKKFLPQEPGYSGLSKVDYPYTDPELNMLTGLEGRILAAALDAEDAVSLGELARDFMAVRAERHSRLPPAMPVLGRYMELVEGTAQYISYKVQYGAHTPVTPLPETLLDPRFAGYAAKDSSVAMLKARLGTLHTYNYNKFATYTYQTGAALAMLLDKLSPSWKRDLFRTSSGKGSGLDTLLERLVAPDNSPARLERAKARYGAPELLVAAGQDLAALLAENKRLLDAFRAAPGPRALLAFPGLTAADLTIYAPGSMVEYAGERLYDKGCSVIEYGNSGAEITFARAVPVLLDKKNATVELVLPAVAPSITADSAVQAGGSTVYEGNVSYNNGLFRWKGARLGVTEIDGNTILTFN